MKFKYGIKNKILIPVLSVTVLSYLITLGYISYAMYKSAAESAKIMIDNQAKIQSEQISMYILPKISLTENMTHVVETFNNLPEPERKRNILEVAKTVHEHNKNFLSVWISRMKSFYDPQWTEEYGRNRITIVSDSVGNMKIIDEEIDLKGDKPNSLYKKSRARNAETMYNPYRQDIFGNSISRRR